MSVLLMPLRSPESLFQIGPAIILREAQESLQHVDRQCVWICSSEGIGAASGLEVGQSDLPRRFRYGTDRHWDRQGPSRNGSCRRAGNRQRIEFKGRQSRACRRRGSCLGRRERVVPLRQLDSPDQVQGILGGIGWDQSHLENHGYPPPVGREAAQRIVPLRSSPIDADAPVLSHPPLERIRVAERG